ncbi:MAG: hypothetical protein IH840_01435 [Candidatus Heimdallarchaeota archaeon]|nr:hypothetical protein [Candidatus Heimdallarchaeota archaeon]
MSSSTSVILFIAKQMLGQTLGAECLTNLSGKYKIKSGMMISITPNSMSMPNTRETANKSGRFDTEYPP